MSSDTLTAPPPTDVTATAAAPVSADPAEPAADDVPAAAPAPSALLDTTSAEDRAAIQKEVQGLINLRPQSLAPMPDQVSAPDSPAAPPPGGFLRCLPALPLRILVGALVLLDWPFGFLGAGFKALIGWLAIGTAVMAGAVWLYGARLTQPSAAEMPPVRSISSPAAPAP